MWPGDNASAQVTCLGQRSQGCRAPLDCKAGHSGKTHNPTGWVMVFLKKKNCSSNYKHEPCFPAPIGVASSERVSC